MWVGKCDGIFLFCTMPKMWIRKKKSGMFGRVKNPTHVLMSAEEIHPLFGTAPEIRPSITMVIRPIEEWDFWESKRKSGEWFKYDERRWKKYPLIDIENAQTLMDTGISGLSEPNVEKMEKKRDVEGLIEALKHKDSSVRYSVAVALSRIGKPAFEPLIQALKDRNPCIRLGAAVALGKIGDVRAVEPLIQSLKDEDKFVRVRVAWALGRIGDTKAVKPLIQTLEDEEIDVQKRAVEALGWIGEATAAKPLVQKLRNWCLEEITVEALGKIGKPAIEPLIQALKDEDPYFRMTVAETLGEIGDERAIEPLIQTLKDDDSSVRQMAKMALEKLGWNHA